MTNQTDETRPDLVARDAAAFFHQNGSSPCLAALRSVSGVWLEDVEGRRLMDLHGNTTHHLGHAHPALVAALQAQLQELVFSPRRYTNAAAVDLAEALIGRWPGGPAKVLFATGGSDAIEIAIKLARVATGRSGTISIEDSYHGHGFGAFGLSSASIDARLGSFLPDRHHVTPYWRQDLGGAGQMIADIEAILGRQGDSIACLIAEPIRSNCHVPPVWLWPRVRSLCDATGVKLIFDEIPSGLGKTGRFFAFEHFGVTPDAAVLGKALGGGLLPIAAVIADASLNIAPELDLGHYTHEKNPLTTRVARELIRVIDDENLVERAKRLQSLVEQEIEAARKAGAPLAGVRGLGALLAVEIDVARITPGSSTPAQRLVQACLDHGLSTTTKDSTAIGFSLPLTVTDDEVREAVSRLARAARSLRILIEQSRMR